MADFERLLRYFGSNYRFTTLASYSELHKGFEVDDEAARLGGINSQFIVPYKFRKDFKVKTMGNIRKIASHLWGGNEEVNDLFGSIEDVTVHEMNYANTSPLRVEVHFPHGVRKKFYAKQLDEKRLIGLELEGILSPHKYVFSASGGAIYEEEVPGVDYIKLDDSVKNDPMYLEALVGLDQRCVLMLLGDMNPEENPHNCLSYKVDSENSFSFVTRPIDFDQLFTLGSLNKSLIFSLERRKEISKILGKKRFRFLRSFEKESMKRRANEKEDQLRELFGIIGDSNECNKKHGHLQKLLKERYPQNKFAYSRSSNMGELLTTHFDVFFSR